MFYLLPYMKIVKHDSKIVKYGFENREHNDDIVYVFLLGLNVTCHSPSFSRERPECLTKRPFNFSFNLKISSACIWMSVAWPCGKLKIQHIFNSLLFKVWRLISNRKLDGFYATVRSIFQIKRANSNIYFNQRSIDSDIKMAEVLSFTFL